jgi:hypothetical protein
MGHGKGRAGGRPAFAMTFCIRLAPSWFIIRKPFPDHGDAAWLGWDHGDSASPPPHTPISITKYLRDSAHGLMTDLLLLIQCHQRKSVVRICFSRSPDAPITGSPDLPTPPGIFPTFVANKTLPLFNAWVSLG